MVLEAAKNPKIVQFAHGKIFPSFSSAYAKRCYQIFQGKSRKIISAGGLVLRDYKTEEVEQYRSLILSGISLLEGNRYFEIGLSRSSFLRRKFRKRVAEAVREYDVLVFEGPWLFPLVEESITADKFVVYDAHNVEARLREGNKFQKEALQIERSLVQRSDLIFVMTKQDGEYIQRDYSVDGSKIHLLPLLADEKPYRWHGQNSNSIVFIGSMYEPNIRAMAQIEKFAKTLPDIEFHIIGSVCENFRKSRSENVICHGVVNEQTKDEILSECLGAINPVEYGGGRNLKILDYMSMGCPVITTPIGFRGLDSDTWKNLVDVRPLEEFPDAIRNLKATRKELPQISEKIYSAYRELARREGKDNAYEIILNRLRST